jgi:mRNA interferase RelE/StbE
MAWQIEFTAEAEGDFSRLDRSIQRRIFAYLNGRIATAVDARDYGKPLLHELSGLWRYRVGDYRILCRLEDERVTVVVVQIGHRSTVYDR